MMRTATQPGERSRTFVAKPGSARSCAAGLLLLLFTAIASAQEADSSITPAAAEAPPPVSAQVVYDRMADMLQPYRVLVQVSGGEAAGAEEALRLRQELETRFGTGWQVEVRPATGDEIMSSWELERLGTEAALPRGTSAQRDKLIFLCVESSGSRWTWTCREWDDASRSLSETIRGETLDPRELSADMAGAVCNAFRPLVKLESLAGDGGEFRIRAGELPPRSIEQSYFRQGDYLVPCLRFLDRNQAVQRVQSLPWTWVRVESVDRGRLLGKIVSAFPNPLPASRRRVEVVALRVRPQLDSTRVLVLPRRNAQNPLAGFRCEVLDELPTKEVPAPEKIELATDRHGWVSVPANPSHPLRYLFIFSGTALLARVPMIPGLSAAEQLEVPDDRARLNVEGETELLEGELIDIVATREVLMARARQASTASKWADLDRFLVELSALPTLEQYNTEIDALQVQGVYQAQQARDRVAEARIKKLCEKVRDAAKKHLDPFRLSEFRREMQDLRRGK